MHLASEWADAWVGEWAKGGGEAQSWSGVGVARRRIRTGRCGVARVTAPTFTSSSRPPAPYMTPGTHPLARRRRHCFDPSSVSGHRRSPAREGRVAATSVAAESSRLFGSRVTVGGRTGIIERPIARVVERIAIAALSHARHSGRSHRRELPLEVSMVTGHCLASDRTPAAPRHA